MSRRRNFFSASSLITVGGIFIGVFAIIVILSVMNGFHHELKTRILGLTPHIVVVRYDYQPIEVSDSVLEKIRHSKYVASAEPFIYTKTVIRKERLSDGIVLRGIFEKAGREIINLEKDIIHGKLDLKDGKIILGIDLARSIGAHVGDTVTLIAPFTAERTTFGYIPKFKKVMISAIFDAGMYDYNTSLAYSGLKDLQEFLGLGSFVSGIEIKLKDINKTDDAIRQLKENFSYPYRILDWMSMNRNIFTALRLEKVVTFIVLILIILVAAFGISGLLATMVIRKTKEIGILTAMGATRKSIIKIFIFTGSLMGIIGTFGGASLGIAVSHLLNKYRIVNLPGDVFFIKNLPVVVSLTDTILVVGSALLISLLATFYPAYKASQLTPVEAIRNE
jgi:lipoprotein-releasing system permease protein